jgi:hypothetical protein
VAEVLNPRNTQNLPIAGDNSKIVVDEETGIMTVVQGIEGSGTESIGNPTIQSVLPVSRDGNAVDVSVDGELRVMSYSGIPGYGLDVAGADTDTDIVTAGHRCRNLYYSVSTKSAILSIKIGGVTHAMFWLLLGTSNRFPELDIPAGAVIVAKNETAGQNYANLSVSIW